MRPALPTDMTHLLVVAFAAASAVQPQGTAAGWTERYFGVGSAAEPASACEQAREHAQGNASNACADRRGTRGSAAFTGCACSRTTEGVHVCNVKLKVLCDGTLASTSIPGGQRGGPKGRADDRRDAPNGARPGLIVRPGFKVSTGGRTPWTGSH